MRGMLKRRGQHQHQSQGSPPCCTDEHGLAGRGPAAQSAVDLQHTRGGRMLAGVTQAVCIRRPSPGLPAEAGGGLLCRAVTDTLHAACLQASHLLRATPTLSAGNPAPHPQNC